MSHLNAQIVANFLKKFIESTQKKYSVLRSPTTVDPWTRNKIRKNKEIIWKLISTGLE